jgi:hypothetical protein
MEWRVRLGTERMRGMWKTFAERLECRQWEILE